MFTSFTPFLVLSGNWRIYEYAKFLKGGLCPGLSRARVYCPLYTSVVSEFVITSIHNFSVLCLKISRFIT